MKLLNNIWLLIVIVLTISIGCAQTDSIISGNTLLINESVISDNDIEIIHCKNYELWNKNHHMRVYKIYSDVGEFYLHINTPVGDGNFTINTDVCYNGQYTSSARNLADNEMFIFIYDDDNISHCLFDTDPTITKEDGIIIIDNIIFSKTGNSDLPDKIIIDGSLTDCLN